MYYTHARAAGMLSWRRCRHTHSDRVLRPCRSRYQAARTAESHTGQCLPAQAESVTGSATVTVQQQCWGTLAHTRNAPHCQQRHPLLLLPLLLVQLAAAATGGSDDGCG